MTTLDLLRERALAGTGKVRFYRKGKLVAERGYAEIEAGAARVAAELLRSGLVRSQRVGIVLATSEDFYHAFFGIQRAGGIPVVLYPPPPFGVLETWAKRTSQLMDSAGIKLLLSSRDFASGLGMLAELRQDQPHSVGWVTEMAQTGAPATIEFPRVQSDEICFLQFSSGTTGAPKAVAISHFNAVSNARAIIAGAGFEGPEMNCVGWLPLYHDMGLVGLVITLLTAGGELTLMPPEDFVLNPLRWLRMISDHRANISVAPNFAYHLAAKRVTEESARDLNLSRWRVALCGAEMVLRSTLDEFAAKLALAGLKPEAITPVYGLAEATLAVTFSCVDQPARWTYVDRERLEVDGIAEPATDPASSLCLASVGRPLRGVQIELRDENGSVLPEGRVGRIWVQGPSVMTGYFERPEETSLAIDLQGWLDTGDRGVMIDGELHICGRIKDLIVIRGRNYEPSWIEASLADLEYAREHCVAAVGWSNVSEGTEELVLFVEVKKKHESDVESRRQELEDGIRKRVAEQAGLQAQRIFFVRSGALPRTSSGKLKRQESLRLWTRGELALLEGARSP